MFRVQTRWDVLQEIQQSAKGFGSCSHFIQTGRAVFPVGAVAHILSKRRRKRSRHINLKLCWGFTWCHLCRLPASRCEECLPNLPDHLGQITNCFPSISAWVFRHSFPCFFSSRAWNVSLYWFNKTFELAPSTLTCTPADGGMTVATLLVDDW